MICTSFGSLEVLGEERCLGLLAFGGESREKAKAGGRNDKEGDADLFKKVPFGQEGDAWYLVLREVPMEVSETGV